MPGAPGQASESVEAVPASSAGSDSWGPVRPDSRAPGGAGAGGGSPDAGLMADAGAAGRPAAAPRAGGAVRGAGADQGGHHVRAAWLGGPGLAQQQEQADERGYGAGMAACSRRLRLRPRSCWTCPAGGRAGQVCSAPVGLAHASAVLLRGGPACCADRPNGSRAATLAPPGEPFVRGLLGTWLAGGIAVPLCTSHPPKCGPRRLRSSTCPGLVLASPCTSAPALCWSHHGRLQLWRK